VIKLQGFPKNKNAYCPIASNLFGREDGERDYNSSEERVFKSFKEEKAPSPSKVYDNWTGICFFTFLVILSCKRSKFKIITPLLKKLDDAPRGSRAVYNKYIIENS
jgi:hypothetical protein